MRAYLTLTTLVILLIGFYIGRTRPNMLSFIPIIGK